MKGAEQHSILIVVVALLVSAVAVFATNWLALIPWRRNRDKHWPEQARLTTNARAGSEKAIPVSPCSINPSGYFISRFQHPSKYKLPVTDNVCYTSGTFDENLHEHISHELADNARRKSDTSWPV